MAANSIVLDYHNSLLRKADLRLLEHPNWLNDTLINFAYEYFEYSTFSEYQSKVAFIGPDTVQFLKLGAEDDIAPCIESLGLLTKEVIFFAINDSQRDTDSGSHWSVMLFNRDSQTFEHYDSMASNNRMAAKSVAWTLSDHIGVGASEVPFKEMSCPQQANSHDCGMYLICVTEMLAHHLLAGKPLNMENITPKKVKESRKVWMERIRKLAEKK